eukprot:TRINITY_DN10734_c0_g2_i27.p1 TRINITY_DN10734_c0_g2~~TRINITY_DN10734_c0_g2_i27.p1  ORF type:complete len:129 (-),score=2.28 TRINITY_DN10734_c0_g2_i27:75-461(-)
MHCNWRDAILLAGDKNSMKAGMVAVATAAIVAVGEAVSSPDQGCMCVQICSWILENVKCGRQRKTAALRFPIDRWSCQYTLIQRPLRKSRQTSPERGGSISVLGRFSDGSPEYSLSTKGWCSENRGSC